MEEDSFPATQVDASGASQAEGSLAAPEGEGDRAASSNMTSGGSAAASPSATEVGARGSSGILTGSRQTSLTHWLL